MRITGRVRLSWARLLKRVFEIDLEHCPNCGGELKIIAAILEAPVTGGSYAEVSGKDTLEKIYAPLRRRAAEPIQSRLHLGPDRRGLPRDQGRPQAEESDGAGTPGLLRQVAQALLRRRRSQATFAEPRQIAQRC